MIEQKPTTIDLTTYKHYTQTLTLNYATSLVVGLRQSSQTPGIIKGNLVSSPFLIPPV